MLAVQSQHALLLHKLAAGFDVRLNRKPEGFAVRPARDLGLEAVVVRFLRARRVDRLDLADRPRHELGACRTLDERGEHRRLLLLGLDVPVGVDEGPEGVRAVVRCAGPDRLAGRSAKLAAVKPRPLTLSARDNPRIFSFTPSFQKVDVAMMDVTTVALQGCNDGATRV